MRIVWHCALNSRTGYSEFSEGVIKSLHTEGADVYAHSWGSWGLPEDETVRSLIQKYENNKDNLFDACHIMCWAANDYHTFKGKKRLGVVFAESSIIRSSVFESCKQIEGVIVVADFTKQMFINSGYPNEVIFIPIGVKEVYRHPVVRPVSKHLGEFVFLAVGVCQLRKNSFMLARAFSEVFPKDQFPKIKLIMKSNHGGKLDWTKDLKGNIEAIWTGLEAGTPDYTTEQMYQLFSRSDCILLPSKGEGAPIFVNALSAGLPLIYTNWGVLKEFFNSDVSYPCNIANMEKGSFSDGRGNRESFGETPNVDVNHFKSLMKHVVENRNDLRDKSIAAAAYGSYFRYDTTAKTLLKALS